MMFSSTELNGMSETGFNVTKLFNINIALHTIRLFRPIMLPVHPTRLCGAQMTTYEKHLNEGSFGAEESIPRPDRNGSCHFFNSDEEQCGRLAFHFMSDPRPKFILSPVGIILNANLNAKRVMGDGIVIQKKTGALNYGSTKQNHFVKSALKDLNSGRKQCKKLIKRLPDDNWVVFEFLGLSFNNEKEVLLTVNERAVCETETLDAISRAFDFTLTEATVVRYMSKAYCAKEIGVNMDISVNTVRAHLRSIYSKIGVRGYNKALKLILQLIN